MKPDPVILNQKWTFLPTKLNKHLPSQKPTHYYNFF